MDEFGKGHADGSLEMVSENAIHSGEELRKRLDALLPSQQPTIDAFFQSSLAQVGSGKRVDRGVRFGEQVANAVLAERACDGATWVR